MKKVTMMYLKSCPHCKRAFAIMEELKKEHPEYAKVDINCIEESEQPQIADSYDYWYVPTYYLDKEKLHEGVPSSEKLEAVLRAALKEKSH